MVQLLKTPQPGGALALNRRSFLGTVAGAFGAASARAGAEKALRGIFVIVATPYTKSSAVDYEDLAHEVEWLDRGGTYGIVWPQMASEYNRLSVEERLRGFKVIADAARGKRTAVVLGVQGLDTDAALNYVKHAVALSPDALIAIPPEKGSLSEYRSYYGALAGATPLPVFIQDTGPHHPVEMPVSFILEMAKEHPNLGYIKEEVGPVLRRMGELQAHRPPMKRVFSGDAGKGMLVEMSQGSDGTMPGAAFADVYVQVWNAWQSGDRRKARGIFAHLLPLINLEEVAQQGYQFMLQRRGVFKTAVSRIPREKLTPEMSGEIDAALADLKPFLRT
jgi:dihydrodipicolinate synthase/N-acetylneuraminate lyase